MSEEKSDDDDCRLPADTQLILAEFLREKEAREKADQTGEFGSNELEENWQLSQFWYNAATKEKLAYVVQHFSKAGSESGILRIALMSAPSLYRQVKAIVKEVTLFEFDQRFASVGEDFHQFDYNLAVEDNYLDEYKETFDIIIADPPFLSEECIEKIGILVQKIAKAGCKIILCSGYAVQDWAQKYLNLAICKFEPEHERNLGNAFASYANFDLDSILAEKA